MSGPATLERMDTFNWELAEAQFVQGEIVDPFSDPSMYETPPEGEIYGRSLSTIRRLGAFMIDKSTSEIIESPEAAQAKVEFFTSVEEGFGTDKELGGGLEVRDFDTRPILNGRVMSKDLKTAITDLTEAGLRCAEEKAETETAQGDRRFLPQLTRSYWDHENALRVDSMARGETDYNTIIVASPYVEEAAAKSGDAYWRKIGYVPHLKRGFVQLYHLHDGELISGSLSFDGSNKQRLREVFGRHGIDIPETEITDNWLKHALTRNLSKDEAKALATEIADQSTDPSYKKGAATNTVEVTRKYGSIMEQVFNESYIHVCESLARGHQTEGAAGLIRQLAHNAHSFNERYKDALYKMRANTDRFTKDDSIVLHELLVYSTIEMMRALHLAQKEQGGVYAGRGLSSDYLRSMDAAAFQNALGGFGAEGALNGRVYSACGLEIALGGADKSSTDPQTVFGGVENETNEAWLRNVAGSESKKWSYKMGFCRVPNCPRGVKPDLVGPCGVCKNCEKHDNRGADLMTLYRESPRRGDAEQRKFDELFVAIANAEIDIKEAELAQMEAEIAPHVDAIFEEQGQQTNRENTEQDEQE